METRIVLWNGAADRFAIEYRFAEDDKWRTRRGGPFSDIRECDLCRRREYAGASHIAAMNAESAAAHD